MSDRQTEEYRDEESETQAVTAKSGSEPVCAPPILA
jgi:hypothetical protein